MKFKTNITFGAVCVATILLVGNAFANGGRLSPQNFNKMYYLAQNGKVGVLREAINRGLNIDAVNPNGDTGLCIAIKRKDYIAYNTFRMSGANARHACTYRIYKEYQEFLDKGKAAEIDKVVGNSQSLYYKGEGQRSWWPWILGGAALGGGIWALSSGGGGSSDGHVIEADPGYGLTPLIDSYYKLVNGGSSSNKQMVNASNPLANEARNQIKFLPNMLDNADYLKAYAKVKKGGEFTNLSGGKLVLGDANYDVTGDGAIGIAVQDDGSKGINNGNIKIEASNGAIGMVASNGGHVINGEATGVGAETSEDGVIDIIFKGNKTGDAVIGMMADTSSTAINKGRIRGMTSMADNMQGQDQDKNSEIDNILTGEGEGEEENTEVSSPNSGTMIGMALFDYYTGLNFGNYTVSATNDGKITLWGGYNGATDMAVSLVGMGSYIDDRFLTGNNNPYFAEKMSLVNTGDIELSYSGKYDLADTALKLGEGGLIGMRADVQTKAVNSGNILIDMSGTLLSDVDVATGMLSVHGAELENTGRIRIINEATVQGNYYGMLGAPGAGVQTGIYKWQKPTLTNKGIIDLHASHAYGMASFAGGSLINNGTINVGIENGKSTYMNNYGMYSAGENLSSEVLMRNYGIINVYSVQSYALYNVFEGSVTLQNDGDIYISNKASIPTGSSSAQVFGGNFSKAVNNGSIVFKVNNATFSFPSGKNSDVGINVDNIIAAAAVQLKDKQTFINEKGATLSVGEAGRDTENKDYGGTYGAAGVWVSEQASAVNKGTITLEQHDVDSLQFNAGMLLADTATAEAYADNYGKIYVNATNSVGMRNDGQSNAQMTNYGDLYVNGVYSYGMSTKNEGTVIFNGRSDNYRNSNIYVRGPGAIGMYIGDGGVGFNYGNVYLQGHSTTAFQLKGEESEIYNLGKVEVIDGFNDMTLYWLVDSASKTFSTEDLLGGKVKGYTFAKASDGAEAYFIGDAIIEGENSRLLVVEDGDASVFAFGTLQAQDKAIIMEVKGTGGATLQNSVATVDSGAIALKGQKGSEGDALLNVDDFSIVNVNDGVGIWSGSNVSTDNKGTINISKGIGIYAGGGDGTEIINEGRINVLPRSEGAGSYDSITGRKNVGILVTSGSKFTNAETSMVQVSGEGNIGIQGNSGIITNSGNITAQTGAFGIYNVGANITNEANVTGSGIGVYQVGGTFKNSNIISMQGIDSVGVYTAGGTTTNEGQITVPNGKGMSVEGGIAINKSTISSGSGDGMYVSRGTASNQGTITVVSGNGMYVASGGYGENTQAGTINVRGNGYGAYVETGGVFVNDGTITYDSSMGGDCSNISVGGTCTDQKKEEEPEESPAPTNLSMASVSPIYVEKNAKFVNQGKIGLGENDIDFDTMREDEGKIVIADGGQFRANSFKGEVIVANNLAMNGFEDTYTQGNAFVGKDNGLAVQSESYMFNASIKENDEGLDVELNRKKFEEIVDDKDLASFWETNYQLQNNEKMYQALKSAHDEREFETTKVEESGQGFYANLQRENMAVLRGLQSIEQNRVLNTGLSGVSVGADYYRTGKDAQGRLSGYADNVYSPYISYGEKLTQNWNFGVTLRGAYADAEYDEAQSSRDNKVLLAFMPILYQNNNFKFLTTPEIGMGYGTYKRRAISGTYEADTLDFYYGLYNHTEYDVDMKVAELVLEAELNLQGSSMSEAKEDDGLILRSNNALSMESGVGVKLRKKFELARQRSLMLAVGVKYYHEFLDPYKALAVGMDKSPVDYRVQGYNEDKNRLRTAAEAVYRDGDFSVAAEIAHNAEKESNIEGGVGVRYNF